MTTTITLTIGELMTAEPALRRLASQDSMSAKTRYSLMKLTRLIAQDLQHFNEERNTLIRELGVPRGDGSDIIEVPASKTAEFQRRIMAVAAVPVTIPWGPLRSVDLPKALASDLLDLGPLCELVDPDEDGGLNLTAEAGKAQS